MHNNHRTLQTTTGKCTQGSNKNRIIKNMHGFPIAPKWWVFSFFVNVITLPTFRSSWTMFDTRKKHNIEVVFHLCHWYVLHVRCQPVIQVIWLLGWLFKHFHIVDFSPPKSFVTPKRSRPRAKVRISRKKCYINWSDQIISTIHAPCKLSDMLSDIDW